MNMYVDSFDDDELEIVLDESEGIEVELDSAAITWSEINGDITKNKSVVEFLNNLPMLPDIPVEGEHRIKAVDGEALWEEDNLATRDELASVKEELQTDINTAKEELQTGINIVKEELQIGIDTKQEKGDYALKSELPDLTPYATNEALATTNEELQADINEALTTTNEALTTAKEELQAEIDTKQVKGDYAVKSELTPLATKVELNNASQALQNNIDGKQDKGDYITKTLYDQTNEAFQNALNGKQATGDYVTNTELENKKYLTSFTEKDPIYIADKPNLALKSELPDLTPYATKEELTSGLAGKQETGNYALKSEIPSLADYVKNTDYAKSGSAGIINIAGSYGTSASVGGYLRAVPKNLAEYNESQDYLFVAKGTLENIKDDYVKRGLTDNQVELTEEELAKIKAYLKFANNADILTAIASIPQFKFSIVSELPATGEKMILYLVPKTGADNDVHNEYIWIEEESKYEYVGTTAVDLTDYIKNTDYPTATASGVIKLGSTSFGVTQYNGYLQGYTATLEKYNEINNPFIVCKGTLENVLTQYAKTVSITQADYDALETKDANTLYLIEEE